jgi:radical SAM/Cys-rich protein
MIHRAVRELRAVLSAHPCGMLPRVGVSHPRGEDRNAVLRQTGDVTGSTTFRETLARHDRAALVRAAITTLQVNIGLRCNLACHHCHVESGPARTEKLSSAGCERILELLARSPEVSTLDITGGAPELHEGFRALVSGARALGRHVIDRCNLTVFQEPGQADTPEFLAAEGVEIVASLPCYSAENVERQRGRGVFDRSIAALQRLNTLGYGQGDPERALVLVYNPLGPSLPPMQSELEADFRRVLEREFGVRFDRLIALTNMPIKRFAHDLLRSGRYDEYMSLLVENFNPGTLHGLMCRSLVSVDHAGRLFDCDFNQALDLALRGPARTIWQIDRISDLVGAEIATGPHCFGCTAGAGSSCGGALA